MQEVNLHWRPRLLLYAASMATILGAIATLRGSFQQEFWFSVVIGSVPMIPLLSTKSPRDFRRSCLIVGVPFFAIAVFLALAALFWLVPSALLVIIAAFANHPSRRLDGWIFGSIGVFVFIVTIVFWSVVIYQDENPPPPNAYVVSLQNSFFEQPNFSALTVPDGSGIGYKVTGVHNVAEDAGNVYSSMIVCFGSHLSPADRKALRNHLLSLPGVRTASLKRDPSHIRC